MDKNYLKVLPKYQILQLIVNEKIVKNYAVSTARNGLGEGINSGKTPRGWHLIRAKIGATQPENTVFVGRRPTGEVYSADLAKRYPNRDWILTRIMWLSGLELGKNRLGNVDTMRRFIYIHGYPDENIGKPLSKGCIRMHSKDILELFNLVEIGTKIYIEDLIV
jgi:lipoprotein-anchoring transpeptidase ErfK/SrfK